MDCEVELAFSCAPRPAGPIVILGPVGLAVLGVVD